MWEKKNTILKSQPIRCWNKWHKKRPDFFKNETIQGIKKSQLKNK